jgi:hypothetical protein
MLIQAITWPAEWMNRRGAKLPASGYKRILGTVIQTIKRHGEQVKFRRFSLYFFKAVQEHMNHHGDEYYEAAKCRSIGAMLPAATRDVRTPSRRRSDHRDHGADERRVAIARRPASAARFRPAGSISDGRTTCFPASQPFEAGSCGNSDLTFGHLLADIRRDYGNGHLFA